MRIPMCFMLIFLAVPLAVAQLTYSNGPFLTHPGQGPVAGSDASARTFGLNILGWGCQRDPALDLDHRIADDFTVPCGQVWVVNTFTIFGFQRYAPVPTSTLGHANYRIWSGQPGTLGAVILHDFSATNQLLSSTFTNCYRVVSVPNTDTSRPIYDVVMNGNSIPLVAGTYWLDFQLGGSPSYNGPWTPPISIPGQLATGNGMQQLGQLSTGLSYWLPRTDNYYPQGFPFQIDYMMGTAPCWTFTLSQSGPMGDLIITDSGGVPGNVFLNAVTLIPGSFPYGPFFGLQMPLGLLLAEISLGPPFTGVLDGSGSFTFTLPGPVTSGVTLYAVGIQGDSIGFVQATPPFSYTTL